MSEAPKARDGDGGKRTWHDIDRSGPYVVWLGANNILATVLTLDLRWSGEDYADLDRKSGYSGWRPAHFAADLRAVIELVRRAQARRVLWLTVPHVTIAPIARGFGGRVSETPATSSTTGAVGPRAGLPPRAGPLPAPRRRRDRAIDSAIDQYNGFIRDGVTRRATTASTGTSST